MFSISNGKKTHNFQANCISGVLAELHLSTDGRFVDVHIAENHPAEIGEEITVAGPSYLASANSVLLRPSDHSKPPNALLLSIVLKDGRLAQVHCEKSALTEK